LTIILRLLTWEARTTLKPSNSIAHSANGRNYGNCGKKSEEEKMQISTKFTIAIHILAATEYFKGKQKITSKFLAGSIGSNPVIIRNIMLMLQDAGIIEVKRGPGGITINRPLSEITYLDIYKAVETNSEEELFRFHENPSPKCPVGRNIHNALNSSLKKIQFDFEMELASHTVQEVYDNILEKL